MTLAQGRRHHHAGGYLGRGLSGRDDRLRIRICRRRIHGLEAVSQPVRRSLFDILIFHSPLCHEHLAVGWQLNVVGSVQIFEDLLRDALEYRRGNLSTLMQSNRRNPESQPR